MSQFEKGISFTEEEKINPFIQTNNSNNKVNFFFLNNNNNFLKI